MEYAKKLAGIKPLIEMQMYRPMLVTLIHEFVDLHRTARFLAGVCQRHSTAMCTAAQYLKQLQDVESLFEGGFNVKVKSMKVAAVVNIAMQLGMTYDYILYLNVLISRLHTVIHHLQSYMLYYLILSAHGKESALQKVQKLDDKCVGELQTEWKKTTVLTETDYEIHLKDGLNAVTDQIKKLMFRLKKDNNSKAKNKGTASRISLISM